MGDILWPDLVKERVYTGAEVFVRQKMFGDESDELVTLLNAIRYLWLVENSVLAAQIKADDPRISYTRNQLVAQFTGHSGELPLISSALQDVATLPVHDFLDQTLLGVWRSALAASDRLAAVVVHFGRRNGA